jgi:Glycosyl transferase family 2
MIETPQAPAMSVVLATPGDFTTIATTVRHLRRQSIASRLELVVVAPTAEALSADEQEFQGFWGHQIIGLGRIISVGRANAAGIRAARGAVVALAEDHCFPEPGWAEALLERYARSDVAAVGPVFRNANPATLVSWCDFVIGYGPWMDPGTSGDQPFLAGHNSSYRKTILLELGAPLEELLEAETVLHMELRRRGHRLVLEPRARAAHTNIGRFGSWLPLQYHCGRVFAAERAKHWGWPRRAFYAAASPLIPGVRFVRAIRHFSRSARPRPSVARLGPLLGLGLASDGLGQLVGYLSGAGGSSHQLTRFEFRRIDHVPESDRQLWADFGSPPEGTHRHA